jgi:hypothetical protein
VDVSSLCSLSCFPGAYPQVDREPHRFKVIGAKDGNLDRFSIDGLYDELWVIPQVSKQYRVPLPIADVHPGHVLRIVELACGGTSRSAGLWSTRGVPRMRHERPSASDALLSDRTFRTARTDVWLRDALIAVVIPCPAGQRHRLPFMDPRRCRQRPTRIRRLISFLRLRRQKAVPPGWFDEPPPDIGVREPRRPRPFGSAGAVLLDPPR